MTCPAAHRHRPIRGSGGRKPGKQPGAPGSYLAWSERPDGTVLHFPQGACECGAALDGAMDLGVVASHQEVEILWPPPVATIPIGSGQRANKSHVTHCPGRIALIFALIFLAGDLTNGERSP